MQKKSLLFVIFFTFLLAWSPVLDGHAADLSNSQKESLGQQLFGLGLENFISVLPEKEELESFGGLANYFTRIGDNFNSLFPGFFGSVVSDSIIDTLIPNSVFGISQAIRDGWNNAILTLSNLDEIVEGIFNLPSESFVAPNNAPSSLISRIAEYNSHFGQSGYLRCIIYYSDFGTPNSDYSSFLASHDNITSPLICDYSFYNDSFGNSPLTNYSAFISTRTSKVITVLYWGFPVIPNSTHSFDGLTVNQINMAAPSSEPFRGSVSEVTNNFYISSSGGSFSVSNINNHYEQIYYDSQTGNYPEVIKQIVVYENDDNQTPVVVPSSNNTSFNHNLGGFDFTLPSTDVFQGYLDDDYQFDDFLHFVHDSVWAVGSFASPLILCFLLGIVAGLWDKFLR